MKRGFAIGMLCVLGLLFVGVAWAARITPGNNLTDEPTPAQRQLVLSQESVSVNSPIFFVVGVGNNIYLYPSNGDTTFTAKILVDSLGSEAIGGTIDDFNGDGLLDIVANDQNGTCILYLNQGSISFERDTITTDLPYPSTGFPFSRPACSGDFNNDGLHDFIIFADAQLYFFTNQGDNNFVMSTSDVTSSCWVGDLGYENIRDVDVGDFDEDGNLDFVLMHYWDPSSGNEMCLYLGNGDGTFYHIGSLETTNPGGSGQSGSVTVVAGDFNGDGHDDLIQGQDDDGDPGQTWLWLGNGNGSFTKVGEAYDANPSDESGQNKGGAGYGDAYDFDRDGVFDVVCTASQIGVCFFKGDTTSATWFKNRIIIGDSFEQMQFVSSPPISFQPEPTLTVTSPNGGENWMVGSQHDITWTSQNFTGNVKIEYSTNGGTDWTPIVSSTENDGTHPWTIPDDPSTNCLVKVSDAADGDPYDVSDAPFTISPQPPGVIAGTVTEIRFPPAPPIPDVLIEVMQGFTLIDSTRTLGDGTYSLEVSPGVYIVWASKLGYVTKTEADVVVAEDETTTVDFQLPTTNITLISPESGEVWFGGDTYPITWTTEGTGIDHIRLLCSRDGGTTFSDTITESTPDGGSHSWETPRIGCRTVVVRAYAEAADDYIWDWGEHMFTLGFGEFVLNRDGYSFKNYSDPNPDDDWAQFVDAFNLQGAINQYPGATVYAEVFEKSHNSINDEGSCFGMSATSILFFTRVLDVTDQSLVGQEADSTYGLDRYKDGHLIPELDHLIEEYHWHQKSAEVLKYLHESPENSDPKTVFNLLLDNIEHGNDRPSTVHIARIRIADGDTSRRGHVMVVINAYPVTSDSGEIIVYDPSAPGVGGRKITVNLTQNTWSYRGWSGADTIRTLFAVPDTILDGPHSLPEKDATIVVTFAMGPVQTLFTDDQGRHLGWIDGDFRAEIPGAGPILFWEQDTGAIPEHYFLPFDICYTTSITGVDTGAYDLDLFAGGNLFQIKGASVDTTTIDRVSYVDSTSTASYITSDSTKSYSSSLIKVLPDTSGERIFTVLNTSISAGDSVNFVVSPDLASFSYINWGGPKTYDLMIEQKGAHADSTFYSDFSLGESTTHKFTPQDWDSLSESQVILEIDVGNDGSIDSTIVLEPGVPVPSRHLSGLPTTFFLSQNYPNPFNPITEIRYALPRDCRVRLEVYNILGQKVATLVDGNQKAGYKTARWDASSFTSGIYFYRLRAGDFVQTRKMVLIR